MNTSKDKLLADVDFFVKETGIKETTLGRAAVQDSRIVERLHGDGTITLKKMDDLYAWMNERCAAIVNPMIRSEYGQERSQSNETKSTEEQTAA